MTKQSLIGTILISLYFLTVSARAGNNVEVASVPSVIEITTGEQPPLASAGSPHNGYLNHIIETAFAQQGITVKFVFLPWSRAYRDTKEGKYVASSYWYHDPRHLEHFYPGAPLSRERVVLFRKKSSQLIKDFEDVKRMKLRIGLTRGYTYNEEIWRYARENASLVSVVNTELQNYKMLLMDRIDVFPAEEVSGWYALNQHFGMEQVKTIETVGEALLKRDANLMFSKAHPDSKRLLQVFDRGFQQVKESGVLEKMKEDFIFGKYASSSKAQDIR